MWAFSVIINTVFCAMLVAIPMNIYQLNSYRYKADLPTLKALLRIVLVAVIGLIVQQVVYILSKGSMEYASYMVSLIPICGLILHDIFVKKKTPLKMTHRVWRQYILIVILAAGVSVGLRYLSYALWHAYTLLSAVDYIAMIVIYYLSGVMIYPIEHLLYNKYKQYAAQQINSNKMIKIGITGSYGKTSVKGMLNHILSRKYNCLATPHSYNTPMGIAMTAKEITPDTQVFIAEMGARRLGDIKELCEIVQPNIGIITGIAPQHMESFKSIDHVIATKAELMDSLASDGVAFYNGDTKYFDRIYLFSRCKTKIVSRLSSGNIHLENIVMSAEGAIFDVYIKGTLYPCSTTLIGEHNLSNIALAINVAVYLGVDIYDIIEAIGTLKAQPHRLELSKTNGGIIIIDDSYNGNIEGAKAAIKALSAFEGRKVVVCQGVVEMGKLESKANYNIGMQLASVANILFAVSRRGKDIGSGYIDAGGNPTAVIYVDSLQEAQNKFGEILRSGDVLLLMNDLPDNY